MKRNIIIFLIILIFTNLISSYSVVFGQTTTKITIESSDQMKYNVSQIKVKAGQSVTITLKHTGKMPVEAMGHNLVILQKGTDVGVFAYEASRSKSTGYVPTKSKQVIAATKLIGGGQSTTITFTAPAKGTYDFICSVPGHYGIMKGKLIVE